MTFGYVLNHMHNFQATEKSCLMAIHLGGTTAPGPLPWLIVKCILVALLLLLTIPVACICCFQFYTVVACKSGEDDDSGIWQTTESWLDVDNNNVLWACYPFKNRQSCTVNYVEKHHPLGGRKWTSMRWRASTSTQWATRSSAERLVSGHRLTTTLVPSYSEMLRWLSQCGMLWRSAMHLKWITYALLL